MEIERKHGPFVFTSVGKLTVNGTASRRWHMSYGPLEVAERVLPGLDLVQSDLFEAFDQDRAAFIRDHQATTPEQARPGSNGHMVRLVKSTPVTGAEGAALDSFVALAPIDGISRGYIDDRFDTWAVAGKLGNVPMSSDEFSRLKSAHEAIARALEEAPAPSSPVARNSWITDLLPDDVLTTDPAQWRAPTSWELRHVVGEGSFTGVSGAKAAELVGVTPQNFRKYTAQDGAATRQKMSYAMWHLLLHRLGVQSA